tara:strand:+ start:586 stop:1101 length:516 start_codon:yes stop_codon:yes gene_type:complete
MQTGIEKFKDVLDSDTCDLIVNIIESNLDQARNLTHGQNQNVIAKELFPIQQFSAELDQLVVNETQKCMEEYHKKYSYFNCHSDVGFSLRKITGATREHVDNSQRHDNRNLSFIIGLNSDYENGEFHFPYQDYTTTIKRGEAIAFPVWFMFPHYVDAPVGYRYTINTWMLY